MTNLDKANFSENVQLGLFLATLLILIILYFVKSDRYFDFICSIVRGRGKRLTSSPPLPVAPDRTIDPGLVIGVREGLPTPTPPRLSVGRLLWLSLSSNKLLASMLALILLIVYGLAFKENGIPALFWVDSKFGQGVAGLSVTLFICLIFYTIFIVDEETQTSLLRLMEGREGLGAVRGLWCYLASMTMPFVTLAILPGVLPAFRPEPDPSLRPVFAWPWLLGIVAGLLIVDAIGRFRMFSRLYWAVLRARGVTDKSWGDFLQDRRDAYGFANTWNLLAVFVAIYGVAFIVGFVCRLLGWETYLNAPFLICLFLGVISTFYAFLISNHRRYQFATVVVLILGILANSNPYKNRFPGLDEYYERPDDRKVSLVRKPDKDDRPQSRAILDNWHAEVSKPPEGADLAAAGPPAPDQKPKLAVIAVSGGAIRAATWSAVVLTNLEKSLPDFRRRLRVITGASGGMLGAAYYTTTLRDFGTVGDPPKHPDYRKRHEQIVDDLSGRMAAGAFEQHDFLTPVVGRLVLYDLPSIFSPMAQKTDRGSALEDAWARWTDGALKVPFSAMRPLEYSGQIPSLVFSPMMVEDGRRLLISNLNLDRYTRTVGLLGDKDAVGPGRNPRQVGEEEGVASQSAIEFFRLFDAPRFEVGTAVRMNASFPYVSPAANLPTRPTRRVVDAGYYDNYGVDFAAEWILRNAEWIGEHTSGVVLIQVRAFPDPNDLSDPVQPVGMDVGTNAENDAAGAKQGPNAPRPSVLDQASGMLASGAQFLTSPINGFASARSAVNNYRNDEQVEVLNEWFKNHMKSPEFFASVVFTCDESAPPADDNRPSKGLAGLAMLQNEEKAADSVRTETLSWTVGKVEKDQIVEAMHSRPNTWRLHRLKTWWDNPHLTERGAPRSGFKERPSTWWQSKAKKAEGQENLSRSRFEIAVPTDRFPLAAVRRDRPPQGGHEGQGGQDQ